MLGWALYMTMWRNSNWQCMNTAMLPQQKLKEKRNNWTQEFFCNFLSWWWKWYRWWCWWEWWEWLADSTLPTCALQGNEGQVKEVKDLYEGEDHQHQNKYQDNMGQSGKSLAEILTIIIIINSKSKTLWLLTTTWKPSTFTSSHVRLRGILTLGTMKRATSMLTSQLTSHI